MQEIIERSLTPEQRMMRDTIRSFVDKEVTPFIRKNWQKEWDMVPENRPSLELLQGAHNIGVRALGIPEEFGGTPVELHGGNGIMPNFIVENSCAMRRCFCIVMRPWISQSSRS